MPYVTASDGTQLYYEEVGSGTALIFLHEFAADHASWEPQLRYFARRHRCIAYSARGYLPSGVPSADAFTFAHFRDDAVAVLDHLNIERAHFVGLSMGAYSSLQVGLQYPERVLSLTLAGVGSGSEPDQIEPFRQASHETARDFEKFGSAEIAKRYAKSPNRIPFQIKDPRGFGEFVTALSRHDALGSAHTQRGFQAGRPSLYEFEQSITQLQRPMLIIVGDEDDACLQPSFYLKQHAPMSGLAVFPKTGHVINLEEPALFNETIERFLALVEAGRWPQRDPASRRVTHSVTRTDDR